MGGACSTYGEWRGAYRVLVGKRPLGRPRNIWENNTKMDLQEVFWGAWTRLILFRTGTGVGNW
jgi:hypothetical protein